MTTQLGVGEPVDLSNCDREPIQIPGSIQPHGVLLAVQMPEFIIRQASLNCASVLGHDARQVIGKPLHRALGNVAVRRVTAALDELQDDASMQLSPLQLNGRLVDLRLHRSEGMLVCELEVVRNSRDQTWFARELTQTMSVLQRGEGVLELAELAVAEVRRLTGYDRVMVYRFDPDGHGEVIAEAREQRLETYLGQHYPATDIPRQARALYLRQILRQIVDIDYTPVAIEPTANPITGQPLDLGLAALRSVSPIHLQYLRNMGVRATLTISLKRDEQLWGMIACHHYSPRYLSPDVRSACTLIGEVLSLQFAREEQADRHRDRDALVERRRALMRTVGSSDGLAAGLQRSRDALRGLCDADGVAVVLDGIRVTAGAVPDPAVEQRLVQNLSAQHPVFMTDRLPGDVPEVAALTSLCGVLAVALPRGVGEYVVWYRSEWRHELVWGGNPNDSLAPDLSSKDAKTLSPRRSFEAWRQAVTGRARPWSDAQVDTAGELARELVEHVVTAMRERLAHVALHDPLTGLPNRTLLLETLEQTLHRRARAGQEHVGVLFLDLDNFKLVNDSLGHGGGDALLQQTAERLRALLRDGDIIARLGGDEFVIVMQGVNYPEELNRAAQRIHRAFDAPFAIADAEIKASGSIGVTSSQLGSPRAAEELIREADLAMYDAKRRGRGRWVHFGRELSATRQRRIEIERYLDTALAREELHLEYQPLLDDTLTVVGFEALSRWDNAELGRVGPDEFIPIAEETGRMDQLGSWVLDTAIRTLTELHETTSAELFMAINVSAAQIADTAFPDRVATLLARHRIDGRHICLEITESILIANTHAAVPVLERLRAQGIKVALDDFGTGFSSLAYLRRLPADILKIDRAFVAELGNTTTDAAVVAAVLELANQLQMRTVAEGVETEEQLDILRGMSCNLLQGYLFSQPLPRDRLHQIVDVGSRRPGPDAPNRRGSARQNRAHRPKLHGAPSSSDAVDAA